MKKKDKKGRYCVLRNKSEDTKDKKVEDEEGGISSNIQYSVRQDP